MSEPLRRPNQLVVSVVCGWVAGKAEGALADLRVHAEVGVPVAE